jgi:hypothetical protein
VEVLVPVTAAFADFIKPVNFAVARHIAVDMLPVTNPRRVIRNFKGWIISIASGSGESLQELKYVA